MSEEKIDCSRCGSCLSACAVYRILLREAASPRGRLATLDALQKGLLEDIPKNRRYIEACMLCGRCEAACSKGVKGREEILETRRIWRLEKKGPLWKRLLTRFYGPKFLRLLRPFFGLLRLTPLRRMLLLPGAKGRRRRKRSEREAGQNGTALYPGCVLGVFYPHLPLQMAELLSRSGTPVSILWEADCCGFPAISQGDMPGFARKRMANERLFRKRGIQTLILPCATGVMAMRAHYSRSFTVEDLGSFLLSRLGDAEILHRQVLEAEDGFWLFHRPCHQPARDESGGWMKVLAQCKKIRMPSREETDCCGFGGLFSIGFSRISRQILQERQDTWRRKGYGGVITDCPGCYMQFKELGTMPVLFFSELFARGDG